ncbi:MAG: hypothetical protein GY853_03245 [PVC group bacterium]|nr:hypothetical protein [PVC group bacterium]
MKKVIGVVLVIMTIFVFSLQEGYAFFGNKKKAADTTEEETIQEVSKAPEKEVEKQPEVKVEEKAPAIDKKIVQMKAMKKKKRAQLNNTMWDIEVIDLSSKTKQKADVLVFGKDGFYSENKSAIDFAATNYTLNLQDDGSVTWETMQSGKDGAVLFWKGELDKKMTSMRGIFSHQVAGKTENYSFNSTGKRPLRK